MHGSSYAACSYMLHSRAKHVVLITMHKALGSRCTPKPPDMSRPNNKRLCRSQYDLRVTCI